MLTQHFLVLLHQMVKRGLVFIVKQLHKTQLTQRLALTLNIHGKYPFF